MSQSLQEKVATVAIIDSHKSILDAFSLYFSQSAFSVVCFDNPSEFLGAALEKTDFDIIMINPAVIRASERDTIVRLNAEGSRGSVILFADKFYPAAFRNFMSNGVKGFIPRSYSMSSIESVLNVILDGQMFLPVELIDSSLSYEGQSKQKILTDIEVKIISYVSEGKTNKEIAFELNLSEMKVKMLIRKLCQDLDSRNRAHLAVNSLLSGII
jgi:Response regulator containing a CheY-like receiver domain and an HTH DNA-binding domain